MHNFLDLFKQIPDKELPKFVAFDVKEFYPSIKEQLLNKALDFVDKCVKVLIGDKKIINYARKLLSSNI